MPNPVSATTKANSSDAMKKTSFPDDDDEVGYGKPPKKNQFKKGQSGNPHGRPKKKLSMKEMKERIWFSEVTTNQGEKITKVEAFYTSLVNDAIKGKPSARNLLMGDLPRDLDELEDFEPSLDDRIEMIKTVRRLEDQKRNQEEEEAS